MPCPRGSKRIVKHGKTIHGCFCERKVWPGGKLRSAAWIRSGRAWLLIGRGAKGAPRGKTRAYAILTPCRR